MPHKEHGPQQFFDSHNRIGKAKEASRWHDGRTFLLQQAFHFFARIDLYT